ncbi:MAG TPA: glutamate racemase [Ignavibacteria bacterium]|nr:glutamate racemase [Ignavibacteria bacterium]HQY53530.1 glutamate racemase [Ignavibacteria bacterium]HRB01480.1 glutamate racemase [Ignavibacteria bacterium]
MNNKISKRSPIGVFDSGIGGLTVAGSLFEILPNENIIYLGDTARLPYGSKSKETVIKYSMEITKFLLNKNVKMIVVACNTATSFALPSLKKLTDIPVLGVIKPGCKAALSETKNFRIGVIGTLGTIMSDSYKTQIHRFESNIKVFSKACSLFVQLTEDGWNDNKIAKLVAKEYLDEFKKLNIDTLILGCTHYPILKKVISEVLGKKIILIDSGEETAKEVKIILGQKHLLNDQKKKGVHKFYVTDFQNKFKDISERFLGQPIGDVKKVKIN